MKIVSILLFGLLSLNIYNWNAKNPIMLETFTRPYVVKAIVDVKPEPYNYRVELVSNKVNVSPIKRVSDTTEIGNKAAKKIKKARNIYYNYLTEHASLAFDVEKIYGVPAELTLAQSIHESAGGTSYLGKNCNNHFGIKAIKGYRSFKGTTARWSIFDTAGDGFMAYGKIVSKLINSLYPKGFDWKSITAWDIAKTAYAGKNNFDYARKCEEIIQLYNITQIVDSMRVVQ